MSSRFCLLFIVATLIGIPTSCSSSKDLARQDSADARILGVEAKDAIRRFKAADPSIERFFHDSYGYVVFPAVGKGAVGIGGAHGEGQVYKGGKLVGVATLSQVTVGFQLGGQEYREIVFFKDNGAFGDFTDNRLEFSGNASAIAARSGAAATADYENGVAVFTMPTAGVMFEASIGGQKFDYSPLR